MPYTPTLKLPEYDEKKYRQGIDTSYYTKALTDYTKQANAQRSTQLGEAQKVQQGALKQAYIQKAQNERTLATNLASAGIRGGASETANLNLANQYGQAVNTANANYSSSVNSINQSFDQNIQNYTSEINSQKEQYLQNQANARWQADREDALNKYNAEKEKMEADTQYWTDYYTNTYSSWTSLDKLKQDKKTVAQLLKNAKTPAEKIRWQQRLGAINSRIGAVKTENYEKSENEKDRAERAEERRYQRGQDALDRSERAEERRYQRGQDALDRSERSEERRYQRGQTALDRRERTAATNREIAQQNRANANENRDRTETYWNNYYMDYYSGASKKKCKAALKTARAALKKAKTPAQKIRIQQQIRAITNRMGVIKNK